MDVGLIPFTSLWTTTAVLLVFIARVRATRDQIGVHVSARSAFIRYTFFVLPQAALSLVLDVLPGPSSTIGLHRSTSWFGQYLHYIFSETMFSLCSSLVFGMGWS